jgi:hypothetical protein
MRTQGLTAECLHTVFLKLIICGRPLIRKKLLYRGKPSCENFCRLPRLCEVEWKTNNSLIASYCELPTRNSKLARAIEQNLKIQRKHFCTKVTGTPDLVEMAF